MYPIDRWQGIFFKGHFLSKLRVLSEFLEHLVSLSLDKINKLEYV